MSQLRATQFAFPSSETEKPKEIGMPDNPQDDPHKDQRPPPQPITQEIQHNPVSARVPEDVGRGVFCTSTSVLHTNQEFLIDFLATMVQPHQIVARIVMTPLTFSRLLAALQENLKKYQQQYGGASGETTTAGQSPTKESSPSPDASPPTKNQPLGNGTSAATPSSTPNTPSSTPNTPSSTPSSTPNTPPQTTSSAVADFYERIKLSDKMLSGVYANVVMIGHSKEEFSFDFITNFYPRSVVTCRVFMAAGRVPALVQTFANSYATFQKKRGGGNPPA